MVVMVTLWAGLQLPQFNQAPSSHPDCLLMGSIQTEECNSGVNKRQVKDCQNMCATCIMSYCDIELVSVYIQSFFQYVFFCFAVAFSVHLLGSFQYITKTLINQIKMRCIYVTQLFYFLFLFFLYQAVFVFLLFLGMVMCANKVETKET